MAVTEITRTQETDTNYSYAILYLLIKTSMYVCISDILTTWLFVNSIIGFIFIFSDLMVLSINQLIIRFCFTST